MHLIEALDIIEEDYEQHAQASEILAELGASAFYGGAQGNGGQDAMQIAREQFYTEEVLAAQAEWDAKVRVARETIHYFESIAPEVIR